MSVHLRTDETKKKKCFRLPLLCANPLICTLIYIINSRAH